MAKSAAAIVPVTTIGTIGTIGPYHMDINGKTADGGIRGPFSIVAAKPNSAPTYPSLWAHDATRERTMAFDADSEAHPLKGSSRTEQKLIDDKVAEVWASASHCHFNRDFQFNSQPTGMQFTPRRSIGGRAWLSVRLSSAEQEKDARSVGEYISGAAPALVAREQTTGRSREYRELCSARITDSRRDRAHISTIA